MVFGPRHTTDVTNHIGRVTDTWAISGTLDVWITE
jgi:hypothetical protein